MIRKYRFGDPIQTDAVVVDIEPECGNLPYFNMDTDGVFTLTMQEADIVYGLGEQIRGINKRGWQYINWNYDNPHHQEDATSVEDQLLIGNEVMIAPVYRQNARGRYVYLPEEMMLFRMRKYNDYDTEILPKGHHYIKAELNELIFFIRNNRSIKFCEPSNNTQGLDFNTKQTIGYVVE